MSGKDGGSKRPRAEEEDDALTPDEEEAIASAEQLWVKPHPWEFGEDGAYCDWDARKRQCLHLSEADIARGPRRGIELHESEKRRAVEAHRNRLALRREIEVDAWIHEAEPLAPAELDARWRKELAERAADRLAAQRAARLVGLSHERCGSISGIDAHLQYMKVILKDSTQDSVARATSEIADKIGEVSTSVDALASATSDVATEIKDRENVGDGLSDGLQAVAAAVDCFSGLYERLK
jgi:hypothetical protein